MLTGLWLLDSHRGHVTLLQGAVSTIEEIQSIYSKNTEAIFSALKKETLLFFYRENMSEKQHFAVVLQS